MFKNSHVTWAIIIALIGYTAFKYLAGAPPQFQLGYVLIVAIIVTLTAIFPLIIAWFIGKRPSGHLTQTVTALIVGIIASVAGYSAVWALVVAPANPDIALTAVAPRGIGWGLLFGALAAIKISARRD